MWRTPGDIDDSWESIVEIGFEGQVGLEAYAGPGRWNDPDMLVVGMYGKGNVAHGGRTDVEYRSQFSLWALLAAPLMIGCDVLAVNQDPLRRQAYRVGTVNYGGQHVSIWAKALEDGSIAVGLFNLGDREGRIAAVTWESIGLHDCRPCQVRDLWTGWDLGVFTREFTTRLERHGVSLVRITPVNE